AQAARARQKVRQVEVAVAVLADTDGLLNGVTQDFDTSEIRHGLGVDVDVGMTEHRPGLVRIDAQQPEAARKMRAPSARQVPEVLPMARSFLQDQRLEPP